MSLVIACPSCGVRLEVAEDLIGRTIRCASCQHVFQAAVAAPLPPLPGSEVMAAPSGLPKSSASGPPPLPEQPLLQRRREVCPQCLADIEPDDTRCPSCGEYLDEDENQRRRERRLDDEDESEDQGRGLRRDCEPHRGSQVLSCGIISLVCAPLALICCQILSIPGLILGILAMLWGGHDLKEMAKGSMDPEGRGATNSGWICGLIGVILNTLAMLVGIALMIFYGVLFFTEMKRGRPGP